ncbi:ComF family protein [Streptococcus oricebi]|uniref:Amidophosphoribosyltransferase n=1 Tax=Streptococcus oricebi TaxID=1547447 RepID=A0ABS5B3M6_9STRE|nr:ComF family protein [Streptococcus oricebi]MBP2623432.1 amidophosphoribosyltransferase [Streptococcus oricebi]
MRDCILCGQIFSSRPSFSQIFLIKSRLELVCPSCWGQFERIGDPHCPTCYKKGEREVCRDCKIWQDKGQAVQHQSIFSYNPAMKDYFSRYKFQGDYLLRQVFAPIFKEGLRPFSDYQLVPIPLSQESWKVRGFNQVTAFLEAAQIDYHNLLGKKEGPAQSSKTREERLASQQNFFLLEKAPLSSKILLVDDIYTTGATLQGAKQLLYENGVKEIMTFSLAR